jgi:light-regulated signal transduction histidine kinase (bacteriophytochrome)
MTETNAEIVDLRRALLATQVELEQASSDMENFTYTLTHDLDAPLRQLTAFSDLLRQSANGGLDQTSERHLTRVVESADLLRRMLDELQLLCSAGKLEPIPRQQDVTGMVNGVIAEIQAEWPGREITWEIGQLKDIECDDFLLREIWLQLLRNAVKFTATRPVAKIQISSTTVPEESVTFRVADNGIGFDPELADRLFMAFQRLHGSKEYAGLGMGLAIVRRVVRRLGGTTWAVGSPGQGAEFFFSLPKRVANE